MNLNENFRLVHGIDLAVYYDNGGKGWRNLDEVRAQVPNNIKDRVTVVVGDVEYWWEGGIADNQLVAKDKNTVAAAATTTVAGIVLQGAAQADTLAAATLADLIAAHNALLAKLRTAGIIAQ